MYLLCRAGIYLLEQLSLPQIICTDAGKYAAIRNILSLHTKPARRNMFDEKVFEYQGGSLRNFEVIVKNVVRNTVSSFPLMILVI